MLIALQNGENEKFFPTVQEAVDNAKNKDTIYIPGGIYPLTNSILAIDKELHFVGVGHNPDSLSVQGNTMLKGSISLVAGSSNSTFEGLYLDGGIIAGTDTTDEDVDNIFILRCNCLLIKLSQFSTNWKIFENVVRGNISGYRLYYTEIIGAQQNLIFNNFINSGVDNFGSNNIFKNNIFFLGQIMAVHDCTFCNNIFGTSRYSFSSVNSLVIKNNIFQYLEIPTGCISSNNISSETSDISSIFVYMTGDVFNNSNNFQLKSTSPGKNAGTDGTDIGVYGGAYPWKAGAIPSFPHIQSAIISPKTDSIGNLNIRIRVSAQDY